MPVLDPATLPRRASHGRRTGARYADQLDLSGPGGLSALRAQVEVLAPGQASSAPHRHSHRDELIVVLSGRPSLVEGSARHRLAPGMVVALPAGGPVHQLVNDSEHEARVVAVASHAADDVITYG